MICGDAGGGDVDDDSDIACCQEGGDILGGVDIIIEAVIFIID